MKHKVFFSLIALTLLSVRPQGSPLLSATARVAPTILSIINYQLPKDTIYVYETVIVYDTLFLRDTIRIKKNNDLLIIETKISDSDFFSSDSATFSENSIISVNNLHNKINLGIMDLNVKLARYLSTAVLSLQSLTGLQGHVGAGLAPAQVDNGQLTIENEEWRMENGEGLLVIETHAPETNQKPRVDLPLMPAQFSIVYPMTTMGEQTKDYRFNFSFNMFSGMVGAIDGFEMGLFFNYVVHDVRGGQFAGFGNKTQDLQGIQFAGLGNFSDNVLGIQFGGIGNIAKEVKGIQFGGIGNMATEVEGIQFAGIGNVTTGCTKGIQFAGIANAATEVEGIQFAGISNMTTERCKGIQFAGIANVTDKMEGIQFAGIGNVSKEVTGMSFGGIFNLTGTLRGVQFGGIVNVIDTVESGISIAMLNLVKKNFYQEFALNSADYMHASFSYKMGMRKFYTIFTAGFNFTDDGQWATGFGFGHRTSLGGRFDFQPEVVGYQYFPYNFKYRQNLQATHLKLGFIFKLNDRFGISVAPSLYTSWAEKKDEIHLNSIPGIINLQTWQIGNNYDFSLGAGISVGLSFYSK